MKRTAWFLGIVVLLMLAPLAACSEVGHHADNTPTMNQYTNTNGAVAGESPEPSAQVQRKSESAELDASRMLMWRATLEVEVGNVHDTAARAVDLTQKAGGYVERNHEEGEASANLTLRIPAKTFQDALTDLEALGKLKDRDVRGEDVTDQYVDTEARLKSKIVLRDRLRALLEKAMDAKDILAIETELGRLQSEIDAMEAHRKSLAARVDYATVELNLHRKRLLGPLGYVFQSVGWALEKLFVIRE